MCNAFERVEVSDRVDRFHPAIPGGESISEPWKA
jgi:hypothetical protein